MTGLEVPVALELTVAIIELVEATIKIWQAAKDETGLPKDMKAAAESLPLLQETLEVAERTLRKEQIDATRITPLLRDCKAKVHELNEIFTKALPATPTQVDSINDKAKQLVKTAKAMWKGRHVKSLMSSIDRIIDRLAKLQLFLRDESIVGKLQAQLEQYFDCYDEEQTTTFSHSGSGNQNNLTGSGTMNVPTITGDHGKQENHFGPSIDEVEMRVGDKIVPVLEQQHTRTQSLIRDEGEDRKAKEIIASLAYDGMYSRRENIKSAERTTYEWLSSAEHKQPGGLAYWLEHGRGMFWLTGKPGSGKSTFMKHISDHAETHKLASRHARGKRCLLVSHFFWIASRIEIQKSEDGLLRSLLFQLLSAQPELVPLACEQRWGDDMYGSPWSISELWTAVSIAARNYRSSVFFLIDGLDEYQPDSGQYRLAEELHKLSALPTVRIMVASRPWRVFIRSFGTLDHQLTMDWANLADIARYAFERFNQCDSDELQEVSWPCILGCIPPCTYEQPVPPVTRPCICHNNDAHKFAWELVCKANGVFLWIALVMDRMCELLNAGQRLPALRAKLDLYPSKLDDYLRHLVYERIDATWRPSGNNRASETAMVAYIMLKFNPRGLGLDDIWMPIWLLAHGLSGQAVSVLEPDFYLKTQYRTINQRDVLHMFDETKRFLQGCFKDFVEFHYDEDIVYTHRSVSDFLETPEMRQLFEDHIPLHFQAPYFVHQLRIACLKLQRIYDDAKLGSRHMDYNWQVHLSRIVSDTVTECVLHRRSNLLPEVMARDMETVAINQLKRPAFTTQYHSMNGSIHQRHLASLCVGLALHGLYRFTSLVLKTVPALLCGVGNGGEACGLLYALLIEDPGCRSKLSHMLLKAGADPNAAAHVYRQTYLQGSLVDYSPWVCFLARRRDGLRSKGKALTIDNRTMDVVRDLVEHGADSQALVPDRCPVQWQVDHRDLFGWDYIALERVKVKKHAKDVLLQTLPLSESADLLELQMRYSRPDKHGAILEARRAKIQKWPECRLTASGRHLLGLPSGDHAIK